MEDISQKDRGEIMNKNDLIDYIAESTGLAKKECHVFVGSTITVLTEALARGEKVTVSGFGTFDVLTRKAKKGINPATGRKITIASHRVPRFRPGKSLKEALENVID